MVKISCLRLELECFLFTGLGMECFRHYLFAVFGLTHDQALSPDMQTPKPVSIVCSRATYIVYKRNTWRTISSTMVTNKNNVVAVFVLCIPLEDLFTLQTGPPWTIDNTESNYSSLGSKFDVVGLTECCVFYGWRGRCSWISNSWWKGDKACRLWLREFRGKESIDYALNPWFTCLVGLVNDLQVSASLLLLSFIH